MRIVTIPARVAVVLSLALAVGALAPASPARQSFRERRVVFVTLTGQGRVVSTPRGIACPRICRSAAFYKSEHVRLVAKPAPGWRLVSWGGSWCEASGPVCAFDLADSHDCAGGMCPVGAFGLRVTFARLDDSG